MKTIRILTLTGLVATAGLFGIAHAESKTEKNDIVAVASGAGGFNTLVAALKAASLVETLQGPGPFTVFAPTDEAFAKLPKGTVVEPAVADHAVAVPGDDEVVGVEPVLSLELFEVGRAD